MTASRLVSATVAADAAGVSVRTVRRWIARGQLTAIGGKRDRLVNLDAVLQLAKVNGQEDMRTRPTYGRRDADTDTVPIVAVVEEPYGHDADTVRMLWERNDRLYRENIELAGRLGFYQSEIQHLQARLHAAEEELRLLKAPAEPGAEETTNHSPSEQNGQDSTLQTASEEPKEQSQGEPASESSTPPVTTSDDVISGGALKRFWRWLMQPV
jgi:hypothetical protein